MRFTVVVERDPAGKYSLTVPALPGYVACGDTEEEVIALAREGIPFHLACLAEEGLPSTVDGDAKVLSLEIAA
ncbi:MAG: type II toxin-antitoxin system HicB family antitoxin [Armatimonadota bacterium]